VKLGNMITYGTILMEKLASEKCTTRVSPCVRYFVDAEGNRITEPEKIVTGNAYITSTEYRKRVDNLKRDEKGKFVKMETNPLEIPNTPDNYQAIDKLVEVAEALPGASKEDDGGIVAEGGGEGQETLSQGKYPCLGNYEDIDIECVGCESIEACRVVTNNMFEEASNHQIDYPKQYETKDDFEGLAEPEPEWVPEYVGEPEIWPCRPKPEKETPDQMWAHVAYYIGAIKQQGIRRVEEDIQTRLDKILGGR